MGIPIRRAMDLMVRRMAVPRMGVPRMGVPRLAVRRTVALPMPVPPTEIRRMVRRRIHIPDYFLPAKNVRISSASSFGSSIAAKWPPRGITVHRWILNAASAHRRGGRRISKGKIAAAVGVSIRFLGSGRQG